MCKRQKYFNCQAMTNCKLFIKAKKCELCITSKEHSNIYDKSCIYNSCVYRKKHCQCVQKKYYTQYKKYTNKKSN